MRALSARNQRFEPFVIDYQRLLEELPVVPGENLCSLFMKHVNLIWIDHYEEMIEGQANVYEFEADPGFFTLFDLASERQEAGDDVDVTEDRVVAVYGRSRLPERSRDIVRQRGFLGPTGQVFPDGYEKGHYIACSMGGGMDSNLFPQQRDMNRGWSEAGKRYRAMEKYCADHPGTCCFVRPLYGDPTWKPFMIEFGVLKQDAEIWVEWFEN